MKSLGKFTRYIPDPDGADDLTKALLNSGESILFFKNEHNADWLDFRDEAGIAVAVNSDLEVVTVASDITTIHPEGFEIFILEEGEASPETGWFYKNGAFSEPPITVSIMRPLTRFQFEMILELLNITQEQVFALINDLEWTDMQKLVARKKVETGGNDGRWSRENPLWDLLGPSLGISSEQIDEKWLEAQAL